MARHYLSRMAVAVMLGLCVITIQPAAHISADPGSDSATHAEPIIIDHTCTDISQIPPYWIEQAKALTFHIAHTSHGSQILSGLQKLEAVDPTYSYAIQASNSVGLPSDTGALLIYDGNNNGSTTYITPELYWSTPEGIGFTESVADTGWFDGSTWTWCGQQSSNTEITVNAYLNTMTAFEAQYPDMRFVLMTGHTDGGSATLDRNNAMVRQYAQNNAMVLFDFADIETYDPLGGGPYVNNSEGTCTWCEAFCDANPSACTSLPDSCAHSDSLPDAALFCKLKGNAFWWMMARLAGWPGPDTTPEPDLSASRAMVVPQQVSGGGTVTFTVSIVPAPLSQADNVQMTGTLPDGLHYVNGSMSATDGTVDASAAPILLWAQSQVTSPVTVTYAATVDVVTSHPYTLTHDAVIIATDITPITRSMTVRVNWQSLYLPAVVR